MRNSEPESGINFNLILPFALLAVLLIVPFSLNSLMHFLSGKRPHSPVIMKVPIDSSAISIPSTVKQYESFDVALNLETKQLSKFLNEIISTASEGTSIQGIVGEVSPHMRAEISGDEFIIDKPGPQEQPFDYSNASHWKWRVTPESSGNQTLKFQLHLLTQSGSQQSTQILELAEAGFTVQGNTSEWLKRNGIAIAVLIMLPIAFLWIVRRRYA